LRGNVLCSKINTVAVYTIDTVSRRLAEVVGDNALVIVIRLNGCAVRISDARGRNELQLQNFASATNNKSAIAIDRTLLGCELNEFLERMASGNVAVFAPLVEVVADFLIVVTISGRRRILMWR